VDVCDGRARAITPTLEGEGARRPRGRRYPWARGASVADVRRLCADSSTPAPPDAGRAPGVTGVAAREHGSSLAAGIQTSSLHPSWGVFSRVGAFEAPLIAAPPGRGGRSRVLAAAPAAAIRSVGVASRAGVHRPPAV